MQNTITSEITKFDLKAIEERFFQVVAELIETDQVRSEYMFVRETGMHNSLLSDIRKGKVRVTLKILHNLKMRFPGVDLNYIMFG